MQIGVEDRDSFEIEDFVHQLGQLRPWFHVQIHLQSPPLKFVKVFHLPAARLGLACVIGHARRQTADRERNLHEDEQV